MFQTMKGQSDGLVADSCSWCSGQSKYWPCCKAKWAHVRAETAVLYNNSSIEAKMKKHEIKAKLKHSVFGSVSQGDWVELLNLFDWTGMPMNLHDESGNTVLHSAVSQGNLNGVCIILAMGADVCARNNGGDVPLHDAAFEGRTDIARMLVLFGADPCITDETSEHFDENSSYLSSFGIDPILLARHEGHCELADWLIGVRSGQLSAGDERLALEALADAVRFVVMAGFTHRIDLSRLSTPLCVKLWPLVNFVFPHLKYRIWPLIDSLREERMRHMREIGILLASKVLEETCSRLQPTNIGFAPLSHLRTSLSSFSRPAKIQFHSPNIASQAGSAHSTGRNFSGSKVIDEALAACGLGEEP